MEFTKFSNDEIERRRKASIEALAENDRRAFVAWYQELCDSLYWQNGKCCAGCDYWSSAGGSIGQCSAAGIMPGEQVMKSIGVSFCSYVPAPDFPFTKMGHVCGLFRDDFDWSTLPLEYLERVGAAKDGALRAKPEHMIARQMEDR